MPTPNKRTIQANMTKNLLYEKATFLFKEKGFSQVTVEEISAAAGVTVGAFYHYFKGKEDLIYLWARERDKKYKEYYLQQMLLPQPVNALEMIRNLIFYTFELYSTWGWEFAAVSYSYIMRNPEVGTEIQEAHEEYFQIIESLIIQGQQQGLIRSDVSVVQLVKDIVRISRGGVIDWCICGGKNDIKEFNQTYVDIYMDGLRVQTKP